MLKGFDFLRDKITTQLRDLQKQNLFRRLVPIPDPSIDLTHNDYLGLRHDLKFRTIIKSCLESCDYPVGAGASRLLGGEHPIFAELEKSFAKFKGDDVEAGLFFASGYSANEGVASVLAQADVSVFSDSLNHASIVDGIRLGAFRQNSRLHVYRHNDLDHLEELLKASQAEVNVIYTESVFSMDGDVSDLRSLQHLAENYGGVLVVDEAHAVGVRGPKGRGVMAEQGVAHERVISINTCGKALAVQGAVVCGPVWFRDWLINKARPFIYSTGPSPYLAAALLASLEYVKSLEDRRQRLVQIATRLRDFLASKDFDIGTTSSHIIPVMCGSEERALRLSQVMLGEGIVVKAVRPPTVPQGTSRLRISLNAALSDQQIEKIENSFYLRVRKEAWD